MTRLAYRHISMIAASLLSAALTAVACTPDPAPVATGQVGVPVAVEEGKDWAGPRVQFYSQDQGSRIMPLPWIMALKLPNGSPFMADSLRRYGFLPNDASPAKLPVGFTAATWAGMPGEVAIGMTCAACHTRQIYVSGMAYRIDGGPAMIDFQTFLSDLDVAVGRVSNDAAAFADFARGVLGDTHTPDDETALRTALNGWYRRYHTLISRALPPEPWGPGRLDAVGLIFNRLTGLDLGLQPNDVIEENIVVADAPVRYPFLWNAHKQDRTQWSGFAANVSSDAKVTIARTLGRNLGQIYGVFADFHPEKEPADEVGYMTHNSANISGLLAVETLMTQIGAPRWPWAIDTALAATGKMIFERPGSCVDCHGERPSPVNSAYWETPLIPVDMVKTDRRHWALFDPRRMSQTGILEGAKIPGQPDSRFERQGRPGSILRYAVSGTLEDFFKMPATPLDPVTPGVYEARVLYGVWAAAPYLHNGSVPTLTELLKPSAQRKASFKVGPAYDPIAVGLAEEQTLFNFSLATTDCSQPASGNSRCGHEGPEYGTELSGEEKNALLEYLKSL